MIHVRVCVTRGDTDQHCHAVGTVVTLHVRCVVRLAQLDVRRHPALSTLPGRLPQTRHTVLQHDAPRLCSHQT